METFSGTASAVEKPTPMDQHGPDISLREIILATRTRAPILVRNTESSNGWSFNETADPHTGPAGYYDGADAFRVHGHGTGASAVAEFAHGHGYVGLRHDSLHERGCGRRVG